MTLILNSSNLLDYLSAVGLAPPDPAQIATQTISARNFNLVLRCPGSPSLLIKQETIDQQGRGRIFQEAQLQHLITSQPALQSLVAIVPNVLHTDRENGIVINRFLEDYWDLSDYYDDQQDFSPEIAQFLGQRLGEIHGSTFQRPDLEQQILETLGTSPLLAKQFLSHTERLHSAIFGTVPLDCLRFYKLYQQFPSLATAVKELAATNQARCLVHNDLKLNNVLIHQQWAQNPAIALRPIDWETCGWGDPASDLGSLLASYLSLWLDSLVVGAGLSMTESLQLATVPLELLQPSLLALVESYFQVFPWILTVQPRYLERVLQQAGLALIGRIEAKIEYGRIFGNQSILTLQVAKQLLCTPLAFVQTMFGRAADRLPIPLNS